MTSKLQDWKDEKISQLEDQIEHMSVAIVNSESMQLAWERVQEIERLRDELSTFRLGKHHAENAELKAENERLRGLLRDVDDGLDDYWVTTKEGVDWICRRSEALGEEIPR